ncbi:MAG: NAD(P)/FAD-dependent oxidoreductase [Bacteroidales bacterium]
MRTADIIVLGAGPAGLFTAIHCKGKKVLVLEKNATPGKKLLISGTGRCNLTHDCKLSDFYRHYGSNYRFLKTALNSLTNSDLISFFNKNGLLTVVDKNGKVFPATQKALDVLQVLLNLCYKNKVEIAYNQKVIKVDNTNGLFFIHTDSGTFSSNSLVIATGGMSYPTTGSTGDGYHFAKQLGHSIQPPKPSLSPVFIKDYTMASISGVSVQNKVLYLYRGDKKLSEHIGDIGFTHKGLSGPGILDFSREILSGDVLKMNLIDMKPDDFRDELISVSTSNGKIALQTYLKKFDLPRSLLLLILQSISIEPEIRIADVTKLQRNKLVAALCEFPYVVDKVGGFNMAMVTAGGVNLNEVNPKTMESRLVPGLYFAGEVLDIDGDTGGYNLQAAFSMGFLVGKVISGSSDY